MRAERARHWGVVWVLAWGMLALGAGAQEHSPRDRLHVVEPIAGGEADLDAEIRVGREVAARILARHPLSERERHQRYVNLVGSALAAHGQRSELDYYFGVIESEEVNAYAAPGGYIFITSGALNLMRDEAELAGVLAHEIAHVNERHVVEALDIRAADDTAFGGLARFFGGASEAARVVFSQAVDQAMTVLFEEGLRHEDELEADREGVVLATRTGYDPQGLHRFLERLSQVEPSERETVSRTHPEAGERLAHLNGFLEEQNLLRLDRPTFTERFAAYVD